jgi:hypothetical protein
VNIDSSSYFSIRKARIRRRILSKENYENFMKHTPLLKRGSSKFFRNLEDRGIISYSEYLFLLCVITSMNDFFLLSWFKKLDMLENLRVEPKSNFQIAFNMFDTDGNQKVDKKEFLVVCINIEYLVNFNPLFFHQFIRLFFRVFFL